MTTEQAERHTAGPWTVDPPGPDDGNTWLVTAKDGSWTVATAWCSEVDARLIAAAPDLLAAADEVRRVYGAGDDEEIANLNSALLALNRAIAKATGEQT